jgi:hypothetical protein
VAWSEDVERSYWPSEPNLCGLFGKNRPYRAMIGYRHRKTSEEAELGHALELVYFFSADRLVLLSWHSPGCWAPVIFVPISMVTGEPSLAADGLLSGPGTAPLGLGSLGCPSKSLRKLRQKDVRHSRRRGFWRQRTVHISAQRSSAPNLGRNASEPSRDAKPRLVQAEA